MKFKNVKTMVSAALLIGSFSAMSTVNAETVTLIFSNGWEVSFENEVTYHNAGIGQTKLGEVTVDTQGSNDLDWGNGIPFAEASMSRFVDGNNTDDITFQDVHMTSNFIQSVNKVSIPYPGDTTGILNGLSFLDAIEATIGVADFYTATDFHHSNIYSPVSGYTSVTLDQMYIGIHEVNAEELMCEIPQLAQ